MNRADRADACRRMLAAHMSYNDISQALKMSTRTISAISRGERGYSDAKVGRPAKLTREMKMFINVNWLADARITDATMTCMVNDHFRTQVDRNQQIVDRTHLSTGLISRISTALALLFQPMFLQMRNSTRSSHAFSNSSPNLESTFV